MLLAALISGVYDDGVTLEISSASLVTLLAGVVLMYFTRNHTRELKKRDGYIIVTFGWICMSFSVCYHICLHNLFQILLMLFSKQCQVIPLQVLLFSVI